MDKSTAIRLIPGEPGYVPRTPPFNLERQERLGKKRAVLFGCAISMMGRVTGLISRRMIEPAPEDSAMKAEEPGQAAFKAAKCEKWNQ